MPEDAYGMHKGGLGRGHWWRSSAPVLTHMYVPGNARSPADGRAYICIYTCVSFFMLSAFCPEPKSHIGQPIAFDENEEEDVDEDIPDAEWQWAVGVTNQTELRHFSVKTLLSFSIFLSVSLSHPSILTHTCICLYIHIQGYACVYVYAMCVSAILELLRGATGICC